jgi:hypothetical protein
MGVITFRSVVDLRRNIENTFKNESNYKNKHLKLKNWFLGQNNIYTSSGKREFTSLVTV